MGFYLLDNPNPNGSHFYSSSTGPKLAVVVHITAGLEDLDGVDDHSAENTARYAASTDREVSWHGGSDTDTFLYLLPPTYTAWHASNYNSRTYGWEISKKHTDWNAMSADWVEQTLRQAAAGLRPVLRELGIPVRKATRAELDTAIRTGGAPVGLISHAEVQPTDRTDPGWVSGRDTFPWARFFELLNGEDEDDMNIWDVVNFRPDVGGAPRNLWDALSQVLANQAGQSAALAAIANDKDITPEQLAAAIDKAVKEHVPTAEQIAKAQLPFIGDAVREVLGEDNEELAKAIVIKIGEKFVTPDTSAA